MTTDLSFLVVEDDGSVRRSIARSLGAHGHVDTVGTCAAALLALRARTFDGLVVDVRMPDGNGLDIVAPARERFPGIAVLVLTGYTEHDVICRTRELRAGYLLKPCDVKQLALLVEEVNDRRAARERRTRAIIERWTSDYRLTVTEAELLSLGADGVARESFAVRRGVRPEVVRRQIHMLLRKTGDDTFESAVNALLREALAEPT
ncbi:MAG: response regulator [Polyangiaceae bacterium]|nr:response regulator [Polyangiaceae bacterium]